MPSNLLILFI